MLVTGICLGLVFASLLFALLSHREDDSAPVTTLKLAHSLDPNHPAHLGMEHLQERVEELSGGSMRIDLYPSGQLGSETECLEKLQSGQLDMTKTSCAPMGNFISRMQVFSFPYLFEDREHYWRVLDGPIGRDLLEGLSRRDDGGTSGLRGLCFLDAGSRNFYSRDREIQTPEDLHGIKIRVMNDPIAIEMVQMLGGSPTPLPWEELYTSLQQGVVDAAENNPPSFFSNSHHEVCKHFSFDEHSRIPDIIVIADEVWQSLSVHEKAWLSQAAHEASMFQRELWLLRSEAAVEQMRRNGVSVIYPDQAPFREAVAPLYGLHAETPAGRLAEQIRASE